MKNLINENKKKIEKTEKISAFLKSVYGKEIFDNELDKLKKRDLRTYVKIYKMVFQ